jgi:hypothetical protein
LILLKNSLNPFLDSQANLPGVVQHQIGGFTEQAKPLLEVIGKQAAWINDVEFPWHIQKVAGLLITVRVQLGTRP